LCGAGDIVSSRTIYGGTYAFQNFTRFDIKTTFVDITKLDVEAAITPDTKVLYCETVSNPLLEVADIAGLSKSPKHNLKLVVDNTSLLYLFLLLNFDIVIHSLTKYINGSSDTVGVTCASHDFINELKDVNSGASILGPTMDSMRSASVMKTYVHFILESSSTVIMRFTLQNILKRRNKKRFTLV
jgi:methionine-gamma-lyase